jgi:hypothetical protein
VLGFTRARTETDRWTAFRSHHDLDAFYCQPGIQGAHEAFTDPRLCAAIVHRLTFGGNIIETGTDSYRLARSRATPAAWSDR